MIGVVTIVGGAVGYALFGGPVPAAIAAVFAATFPLAAFRARRAARLAEAREAWPRLLEELRLLTGSLGRSIPQALFEVGHRAPGEMRGAFAAAEREWLLTTDFERTLRLLRAELADATADAVCETLVVAHEIGGGSLDRRLAGLVEDRTRDVQARKDARSKQAGVRFARRFVLLVPLGMTLAGLSIGSGRSAYQSPGGQLAVAGGLLGVIGCWLWSGRLLRLPEEPRVFAGADDAAGRVEDAHGIESVTRLLVLGGLLLWAGATVLLGTIPRLSRPGLAERLRPYHPGAPAGADRRANVQSLAELWTPLVRRAGDRLAGVLGVGEDLTLRLRRIHSPLDGTAFRVRQFAWTAVAFGAAVCVSVTVRLPAAVDALVLLGFPMLAFLLVEQRLAVASTNWQQQVMRELPVVSEQLAMLLGAGFSLGAALNRLAGRGNGCCARDLRLVTNRVRQGMTEEAALAEWARVVRVDAVDRLVAVLALDSATGDLGRLVGLEATQARREAHRRTGELIERRAQQVWVPVTVATLVPGVILLAVPFLSALHQFANA